MAVSIPKATPPTAKRRWNRMKLYEHLTGYTFILPAVLLIGLFGLFPIVYALYMSGHRWRVRQGAFVGLQNFTQLVGNWWGFGLVALGLSLVLVAFWLWTVLQPAALAAWGTRLLYKLPATATLAAAFYSVGTGWGWMKAAGDARFLRGIEITLYYALGTIPMQIALGLVIAYVLFQNLKGQQWFRVIFFVPYIVPITAAAVVFARIFSPRETSFANTILSNLGLGVQRLLHEPRPFIEVVFGLQWGGFWAGPSMALVVAIVFGWWVYTGFNVLIFLAGLGGISNELYEASEIDGANRWQSFGHITLPLLSPITFYLSLISFINVLQVFTTVYVMRPTQALGTMDVAGIVIFDTFYARNQYGLATAQAILLFAFILYITLAQYRILGKRVFSG